MGRSRYKIYENQLPYLDAGASMLWVPTEDRGNQK